MKIEARHGKVLLEDEQGHSRLLTREEAADLLVSVASAIQHAGDICEPRAVHLHEEVRKAVVDFKRGDGE